MTLTDTPAIFSLSAATPSSVFQDVAPPSAGLQVCVIVPVRNEAAHIYETLTALYHQADNTGFPLEKSRYEVLLLANNCNDDSALVAEKFRSHHPDFVLHIVEIYLPKERANIGTVRRLLMDEACHRLSKNHSTNGIIASTDGDTIVDKKWVYSIMQEIAGGADAVGGRILTRNSNSPVRLWHLRDVAYRTLLSHAEAIIDPCDYDPWPRHFQYFGASLAVTCRAYERAGRLPRVPYLEDSAFCKALTSIDARIRRSNQVKVYTSDRMNGRVEIGFSEQLKKWNSQQQHKKLQMIDSAEGQLLKLKIRKLLRHCYQHYLQTETIDNENKVYCAEQLSISVNWLEIQIKKAVFFGELWNEVEQQINQKNWNKQWPAMSITSAIAALKKFIRENNRKD